MYNSLKSGSLCKCVKPAGRRSGAKAPPWNAEFTWLCAQNTFGVGVHVCAAKAREHNSEQVHKSRTRRSKIDNAGVLPVARKLEVRPPGDDAHPSTTWSISVPQNSALTSTPRPPCSQPAAAAKPCNSPDCPTSTRPAPPFSPVPLATSASTPSAAAAAATTVPSLAITTIGQDGGALPVRPPEPSLPTGPGGMETELLLRQYRLSEQQLRQLEVYLDYLLEVNQSMNLTAVRDKGDAWQRHVADSLALLPIIDHHMPVTTAKAVTAAAGRHGGPRLGIRGGGGGGGGWAVRDESSDDGHAERADSGKTASSSGFGEALRLVDVGTGAGLPGMVLAVARPEWKVTLLDSLRKRCDFLREAASRAGLRNVEVVWCRAEEGGRRPELRQAYDIAVARAVAETRVLAELCLPFVRVGGLWVAAKGPDPEAEVAAAANAIRQLGGRQIALERVDSYSLEGQRTALVVAKAGSTPSSFPRQPGTPNKKPL